MSSRFRLLALSLAAFAPLGVDLAACSPQPTQSVPPTSSIVPSALPSATAAVTASATASASVPVEPPSKWAKCGSAPQGMVCIPGGEATVGSTDNAIEQPPHMVEVSTFYVDKYEVRNSEYEACEKAKACPARIPPDPTFLRPNQPAVPLTWHAAHAYCRWAGKRMLTEAEWEKVARGGTEARKYPWGNEPPTCARAQFDGCAPATTKDVGSFPAGAYGVFDMAGNGYEWVQDWGSGCFDGCATGCGAACTGLDPLGPCAGASQCKGRTQRVLKGGSWFWPSDRGRGAHRRPEKPSSGVHRLSVRCASDTPDLATQPPLAVSDPLPARALPSPPTAAQLALFRNVTEDTNLEKMPTCEREGLATHTCRDPASYVVSNEPQQQLFKPYIANLGGGYVGLGSDQGYSFVAAAKSEWAWLFDYDPAVVRVHYILRGVILASPTRQDFLAALEAGAAKTTLERIRESLAQPAFPGSKPLSAEDVKATEAYFNVARKLLHENYSAAYKNGHDLHWLRSEEAYKYIYTLHQQGRIVPLKANLLSNAALPTVAEAAKKLGVPIRVFYTSNADDQWPLTDEYRTNVLAFPFDRRAVMIHTTLSETRAKKRHDWDYIIHDGRDIQRRFRAAGWTQMRWLNGEGHRVQPNLVTIGLPGRTALDEAAKPSGG